MELPDKTWRELIDIVKRRKWSIILPACSVMITAILIIFLWPPTYQSTSTILIEEQGIPRDFVVSAITGYAEQRLQNINQRIMSASKLLEIIKKFNLYSDLKDKWTTEEIVEKMRREDIKFEAISSETADKRKGSLTIAFTVSYLGKNPQKVQEIANVLASLYLEENLKVREKQAESTSKFLEDEMKSLKIQLEEIEGKIAVFKAGHSNELPELLMANHEARNRLERDIEKNKDELRVAKEKELYLQTQFASIAPDAVSQDRALLRELNAKLVLLKSRYKDDYPDVIKTKHEIKELETRLDTSTRKNKANENPKLTSELADNASYVSVSAQLAALKSEIVALNRQSAELERKRSEYQRRIDVTPKVEEDYKSLLVQRNNTQAKYDELMRKFMDARVSQGLEKEQMGERFTLIDPARLPEKPIRPNATAILLIGIVMSVGAGIGFASFREYIDDSYHSADLLAKNTSLTVLAGVPLILTDDQERNKILIRNSLVGGIGLAVVLIFVITHFFIKDIDVVMAIVLRRINLLF